jgi:hypothetical protein
MESNFGQAFQDIKASYTFFNDKIKSRLDDTGNVSRWVDPYLLSPACFLFTPIEDVTWKIIRNYGKAPFYPQYPIGGYFLDFGNPNVKVGIECDGKAFHTDKAKDLMRDKKLFELGWTVYRISGADCMRVLERKGREDDTVDYSDTIEGLIESIGVRHFDQSFFGEQELKFTKMCKCLTKRVSVKPETWDEELSILTTK